ncbi:MAG: hypothetical protein JW874_05245 [Spirochaetales bacterium]|nr:hypothetical protein [Spirochaetales bacterium]
MSDQLKAIIEKIKTDGIKTSNEKSAEIINKAKEDAKSIISDAKKQSEEILASAAEQVRKMQINGKAALVQAGRDLILFIQKQLAAQYNAIILEQIKQNYSADAVTKSIQTVLQNWSPVELKSLDVILPEKDYTALKAGFGKLLADQIKSGIVLKKDNKVVDGFRISEKNGSFYYDFSSNTIAEFFSGFLSDDLAQILKDAAAEMEK